MLQFKQEYNDAGSAGARRRVPAGAVRPDAVQQRQRSCRSASTFVQETTVFREYGPLAGNTVRARLRVRAAGAAICCRARPPTSTRATTCASAPTACWRSAPAASRAGASSPATCTSAATRRLRGYDYLEFLGNKAFFANAELRFPLIEAALTPIGVVGGLRGVFFANFGGAGYEGLPMTVWTSDPETFTPLLGYEPDPFSPTGVTAGLRHPITHRWLPADRQPRLLRRRARDVRARLPDPLRLVVAHAVQQGLRGHLSTRIRPRTTADGPRERLVPQAQVLAVDRLRFLEPDGDA